MQKMPLALNRESAKLVPMANVAGNAGGTTIVTRSKARTTIKCHSSWRDLVGPRWNEVFSAYLEPYKVDERSNET